MEKVDLAAKGINNQGFNSITPRLQIEVQNGENNDIYGWNLPDALLKEALTSVYLTNTGAPNDPIQLDVFGYWSQKINGSASFGPVTSIPQVKPDSSVSLVLNDIPSSLIYQFGIVSTSMKVVDHGLSNVMTKENWNSFISINQTNNPVFNNGTASVFSSLNGIGGSVELFSTKSASSLTPLTCALQFKVMFQFTPPAVTSTVTSMVVETPNNEPIRWGLIDPLLKITSGSVPSS